ncbi:unnamed protein product [Hyaloperonospora brassicae]|uniref:RxLR effector candidate protein n=1 Tax=Hyaloperonospora brassicae TaxID=162125 RepID=A0AAV0TUW2_HYABA|nr:unnamed protein product [Hyaloperonospora brassicae]
MHLSYIIAILTTVGSAVCAIPDLQQLKSLPVAGVAQPPVQITQSDPGVSKRSLRVHKLEDEEDDGDEDEEDEENKNEGDEEDKLSPTEEERAPTFSFLTNFKPLAGTSTASITQSAALRRAEIAKKSYPLSTTSGAQAGRVSMQPATKIAPKVQSLRTKPGTKITPTLKSVDEGEVVTPARVDELLWGPKTVQKLDDVAEPAMSSHMMMKVMTERNKIAQKYRIPLADPEMTAKKFRSAVDQDDLKRGVDPDVIYSTAYLSRWLDDMKKYSGVVAKDKNYHVYYKQITSNPDALKRFGPLMDETRYTDDVAAALGRGAKGASSKDEKTAKLLADAHAYTKEVDVVKATKVFLVEDAVKKEKEAVTRIVKQHAQKAVTDKWDLETMMKTLKVTDQTPRDSFQHKALNELIISRMRNDLVRKAATGPNGLADEAVEVTRALEKNALAQKHLVDVISQKPSGPIMLDIGVGKKGLSKQQLKDAEETWTLLKKARNLGQQIKLGVGH